MRGALILALLLVAPAMPQLAAEAQAAPIKATQEKGVQAPPSTAPKKGPQGGAAGPAIKGIEKLPPEMQAKARAIMAQRLKDDLAQIGKLRDEAEKLLEAFVRDEPKDSPDLPEALLKLAEIKWEKAREKYLADFGAWEKLPVGSRGPAPKLDLAPSRALVKQVIDRFPNYPQYDLALYVDGALAGEEGKDNEALADFEVILAKYPKSRFAPDAHMAKGEAQFNATKGGVPNWQGALDEYEVVLQHPESELYGLAMFKSAWCLWKLGREEEAAKRFTKVLDITAQKSGGSMAKRQALESLEDEALKALVDVFLGDEKTSAQDVYAFLQKIGGERFAGKIVRKLAAAYEDAGRFRKAIEAWELVRKLEPTSPEGTQHVLAIARDWTIERDEKMIVSTYQRLLDDHLPSAVPTLPVGDKTPPKPSPATWAKSQLDPAVVEQSTKSIEIDLRTRAFEIHAHAQATKDPNEFRLAKKLYHLYLTRFSSNSNAYEVLFYVAEIEYHRLGEDTEAARDYLACAKMNPKGGLSRDALFNALSALERQRQKELESGKVKPGEETETDKKFAETLAFYAATFPNDPEIPGFLLNQGITYYDHKVYDPAIKIFGELLTRYPNSKEAQAAGDRMIDSLVHAKDFGNVETWCRKLQTLPAYQSEAQQKKLDGLIVQAVFKQGESLAAKGDHVGAANAYLRAAKEFPKDERAPKACVNAVIEGKLAGELGVAQSAADLAIKDHAGKPEAAQAIWAIAEALRAAGLLGEAAAYDEKLVEKYPKDSHARDASFNAVAARTALGNYDLAVKDANDYLRLYGSADPDDADEITFLQGQAHEKAKKWNEAAKLYSNYVTRAKNIDHKVEAYVRLAQVKHELKDGKGEDQALDAAVKLGKSKGKALKEGRVHAAHARYMQGEKLVAEYDAITLDASGDELKKRLNKKKELLKQAGTVFADVATMGAPEWTTAALYRIGYIFEGFANALKAAKPPASASPAEQDAFHEIVDPIATQFSEKAIDSYEGGWKKAVELKIFNKWTAEMRAALARLNDVEYPALRELGLEIRSVGPAALPEAMDPPAVAGAKK
ncbi:MAG: tetratricopeptide repeat protein [Polyangiales bacterium]